MKSRILRWSVRLFLGGAALVVLLVIAGAIYQAIASSRDAKRYPPPGAMVDVDGHKVHLNCTGEGSPTVILIAGLGDNWTAWGKVQPQLSELTRACSYDRAGLGHSEPGPTPRDAAQQADELSVLLDRAGIEGPYVVVGHSLGGLYARVFADRERESLAGMVLIDPSHEDQRERSKAEFGEQPDPTEKMLFLCRMLAPIGVVRLSGMAEREAIPEEIRDASTALGNRSDLCRAVSDEYAAFDAAADQTRATGAFGDLPWIVVSSGKRPPEDQLPPSMTPEILDRLLEIMAEAHQEVAGLSTRGERRVAEEAGHYVQLDQPEIIVEAIRELVEDAR